MAMQRWFQTRSVEQQLELKELAKAVIGPLKRGLCSFNNVSQMFLSIDADIVLPGCPTFSDVRLEIENMKQQMEESEQVATNKLHCLDEETERLTAEQSLLAEQKKQRESELENLKTQLESYRSSLESYTEALETERRNLRSAEDTLGDMTWRRDEAARNVEIGAILMVIPIVGWIAGGIMIGVGEREMSEASDAVDRAKKEVENCESQGRPSVSWGCFPASAGSAAELQTRHQILLEPVVKVMEEITTALGHITGERICCTQKDWTESRPQERERQRGWRIKGQKEAPTSINNMDTQIAKTTQSLTTAAEMRETTKMLMKPNANWEEYLTPAPLSIAIMGELVFISSSDDFSINKNPPKDGFKFIKYPESFGACHAGVCNSGWLNEAHKNMDQIRIHTSTVPDYMKAAVDILFNGTDNVIENLLPNQLDTIRTIADECVTLADSVEKKYADVINLIQELLEACTNAEHFHKEELEKVKMKLEENKLREQSARQLNDRSKKAMEDMSKQVEEAQNTYKKAMDSLPSGWEMIGMDFVDGLLSLPTTIINGVISIATSPFKLASDAMTSRKTKSEKVDENVDEFTQMKAYSKSAEILKLAASLKHVSDSEIDWKNLYDQKE
ncbi:uncharacterized protein AKAME5_002244400 [Lates japonicus]|uniref:Uncharacterized protein n=1 Tax=Lates japonicus TaxID=270547 RepID=A0AAD3NEU9_LATJO|nr:uncharacterized protein AKAME5_002244400 [Lates japonicus]